MVFLCVYKKQQSLPIHSNNLTFVFLYFMLRYKIYIFPYMQTGGFHEKIWSNF